MKAKTPPIPKPTKQSNKNPGGAGKMSSSKTMTADGHLSGHQPKIASVAAKNKGC